MRRLVTGGLALIAVAALGVGAADAATPSSGYATYTIAGSAGAYTGTVALPVGFPLTTFTSDSAASTEVGSGSNTWPGASTPFGAAFGSGQGKQYLSLRTRNYNSASTSTTTYTFAGGAPVGGWGVALGDIDAETLEVSATAAGSGTALTGTQLGLQAAFNACAVTPRASGCAPGSSAVPHTDVLPTSVVADDQACPTVDPSRCNTTGEMVWLSPTVSVGTLTVTSTWKSGSPSYFTWFATAPRAISGRVTTPCGPATAVSVQVLDASSTVVATRSTTTGGSFSFSPVSPGAAYFVRLEPATVPSGASSAAVAADTTSGDATGVDVALTRTCYPVSGSITDSDGDPAPADIVVTAPGDPTPLETATTDAQGRFALPPLPDGDYELTARPAGGGTASTTAFTVAGAAVAVPPITVTPVVATSTPTPTPTPTATSRPTPRPTGTAGSGTGEQLAATGIDPAPVAIAASAAILLGAALVGGIALRRRRRA